MRSFILIGVAFIVLGIVALVNKGIDYKTHKKVLDIGSLEATTTQNKTMSLSPILGVVSLVGGIGLVIVGSTRKSS